MNHRNPTSRPVSKADGSGEDVVWDSYQTLEDMPYLDIDNSVDQKVNYRQQTFEFWQNYLPYISGVDTFESSKQYLIFKYYTGHCVRMDNQILKEIISLHNEKIH